MGTTATRRGFFGLAGAAHEKATARAGFGAQRPFPLGLQPTVQTAKEIPGAYTVMNTGTNILLRSPESYSARLLSASQREPMLRYWVAIGSAYLLLAERMGNRPQRQWLRTGFAQWVGPARWSGCSIRAGSGGPITSRGRTTPPGSRGALSLDAQRWWRSI